MHNWPIFAVLLLLLAGCDQGPPQGKVHGTVSLNGELVNGGVIRFVSADGSAQPMDTVIVDGKYELTLPTGKRKVELTWSKDSGAPPDTASQGTTPPPKELFPTKYNSQTTLEYEVVAGENPPLNYELKAP